MRNSQSFSGWIALTLALGCQAVTQRPNPSHIPPAQSLVLEMIGHEEQLWDVTVYHRRHERLPAAQATTERIHFILGSTPGYEQPFQIPTQNYVERIVVHRVAVREVIEPCFDRFCGHILLSPTSNHHHHSLLDSDQRTQELIFVEDASDQPNPFFVELQPVQSLN